MKCTIAILLVFISTSTFAVENSSDDATEPTTLFDVSETESYDEIEENNGEPHSIRKRQASQSGPYIVELLVVVDKEFGDLFQQDYWKIKDYLTIYFWDVNMRFKTLWGVDVTFRVNSLLTMRKPEEQPFIEKARAADGRTNNDRILHLFKFWVYEQQSWLSRQDVAILLTATKREWNGGLSFIGGACTIWEKADYGAVVINDDGNFQSAPAASHELAHSLNAKHDNDPSVNFPGPYNFIMATDYYNQTAFSKVSNEYISNFVKSDSGACVRRIDGYETTPIDRSFSSPKAPNMQDLCKLLVKDPNAWIDTADTFNCQVTKCKRRDANNNVIPTEFVNVIQNLQCGNGGRCFRGRCRPESKLLKHVASGNCLLPDGRFSYSVGSRMVPCPSSKDKTPLDTIEVIDFNGKRLATPFLYNDNNESSDKCIYTGTGPNDIIWTDRCGDNSNPWHAWDFKPVNGDANKFQLVHRVTGRCVRPGANPSDYVFTGPCTTDANLVWTWTDGV